MRSQFQCFIAQCGPLSNPIQSVQVTEIKIQTGFESAEGFGCALEGTGEVFTEIATAQKLHHAKLLHHIEVSLRWNPLRSADLFAGDELRR